MDVIYNLQGAVCLLIRSSVWKFPVSPKYPCVGTPVRCPVLFWTCTKRGPGRIEEESIDGMGTLCCAAMISSFLYPWCSSHTYQGWRVWIHRKERDQSVSKAGQTWMGSRAKRTKPATPHRRPRSLNGNLFSPRRCPPRAHEMLLYQLGSLKPVHQIMPAMREQ